VRVKGRRWRWVLRRGFHSVCGNPVAFISIQVSHVHDMGNAIAMDRIANATHLIPDDKEQVLQRVVLLEQISTSCTQ
jgi:hypothetical protein